VGQAGSTGLSPAGGRSAKLALPLLVAGILANHADNATAADYLAFIADAFDAGADFHDVPHDLFEYRDRRLQR